MHTSRPAWWVGLVIVATLGEAGCAPVEQEDASAASAATLPDGRYKFNFDAAIAKGGPPVVLRIVKDIPLTTSGGDLLDPWSLCIAERDECSSERSAVTTSSKPYTRTSSWSCLFEVTPSVHTSYGSPRPTKLAAGTRTEVDIVETYYEVDLSLIELDAHLKCRPLLSTQKPATWNDLQSALLGVVDIDPLPPTGDRTSAGDPM